MGYTAQESYRETAQPYRDIAHAWTCTLYYVLGDMHRQKKEEGKSELRSCGRPDGLCKFAKDQTQEEVDRYLPVLIEPSSTDPASQAGSRCRRTKHRRKDKYSPDTLT